MRGLVLSNPTASVMCRWSKLSMYEESSLVRACRCSSQNAPRWSNVYHFLSAFQFFFNNSFFVQFEDLKINMEQYCRCGREIEVWICTGLSEAEGFWE